MNYRIAFSSLFLFLFFCVQSFNSQIIITSEGVAFDTIVNVDYIIKPVFLGSDYQISNIDYTGSISAVACFEADGSELGVSSGILLSTGVANTIIGPNDHDGSTTNLGEPGTSYFPNLNTYDASILAFDFIANVDSLHFTYVFGSEEYLEFVNAGFNDRFAIYLSGPGIVGEKEISKLPNGGGVVSIDNIHSAGVNVSGDIFPAVNGQYYVNNTGGSAVEFDGYTTPIEVSEALMIGETYHLTVIVADVGDGVLDSGVFLENCDSCACEINESIVTKLVEIKKSELVCFPNPSQGSFSIQLPNESLDYATSRLVIVDVTGKLLVDRQLIDQSSTLHVNGLASGMYVVYIKDVNNTWSSKVIVAD